SNKHVTSGRGGRAMRVDDLILVSVDDHVVEPPDVFEGRLSRRAAERAPYIERLENGPRGWPPPSSGGRTAGRGGCSGARRCPTSGSTPSRAGCPRSTASTRWRSPRCAPAATTSTS